jgi:hypothetical protein
MPLALRLAVTSFASVSRLGSLGLNDGSAAATALRTVAAGVGVAVMASVIEENVVDTKALL